MFEEHSIRRVIQEYLFSNLDLFRDNLEKAERVFDPEAIHDFRVAVKRIRAIVRAVNRSENSEVFPEEMILPLRMIFKAGGTIRDDQVQLELIDKFESEFACSFPNIREFFRQRINEQRDSFFIQTLELEHTDVESVKSLIQDSLAQVDDHELEQNLYSWFSQAMQKLRLKRYDLEKPEKLHEFRTRYKQNGYIIEMIYQAKHDRRVTKASYNKMKSFGQELGNWHDYFQLRAKTAFIFNESRNVNLLEEAFELRKLVTPIHDKLFQEILHQIKRDDTLFTL
jgi:CHAD domain-containing protein